jgi:TetR/AcrR family transcriptional regulator
VKRDPDATRAAILDAAERVFLGRGFGAASLSDIAEEASVTKSLIHHHFGSKNALWEAVKERRFIPYAERQLAMMRSPASAELVRTSFEAFFEYMRGNPELVRILAWVFLEGEDEEGCVPLDKRLMTEGAAKFREGQEAGILRKGLDPRLVLFVFVGLVQHWFQDKAHFRRSFDIPDSADLDQAYRQAALDIFLRGVSANPGANQGAKH